GLVAGQQQRPQAGRVGEGQAGGVDVDAGRPVGQHLLDRGGQLAGAVQVELARQRDVGHPPVDTGGDGDRLLRIAHRDSIVLAVRRIVRRRMLPRPTLPGTGAGQSSLTDSTSSAVASRVTQWRTVAGWPTTSPTSTIWPACLCTLRLSTVIPSPSSN